MADTPYTVELWDVDEFFRELETFPESQQARITEFMSGHLRQRPRVMIPGQLKRLQIPYAGLFQLNCGHNRRLLCEVDDQNHLVRIVYLGSHPAWEKWNRPFST